MVVEHHPVSKSSPPARQKEGPAEIVHSRSLILIAAVLLMSQIASPLVEYQFLSIVKAWIDIFGYRLFRWPAHC